MDTKLRETLEYFAGRAVKPSKRTFWSRPHLDHKLRDCFGVRGYPFYLLVLGFKNEQQKKLTCLENVSNTI